MRQALTVVYLSDRLSIENHLCLGRVVAMTDETSSLRERVRSRYAEAARAVLEPRPGVTAQCVEISGTGQGSATVLVTTTDYGSAEDYTVITITR